MADNAVKTAKKPDKNAEKKDSFFKKVKSEFKKIAWTDRKTLVKQTIAVIVISIILCIIITLVDNGALVLIEKIIQ
ncbi:MAG: preprotein translocase subunit SecE [Eubacterium sp.]|nr:preprotein translocase subunit SecE [Eubacterium sp.]